MAASVRRALAALLLATVAIVAAAQGAPVAHGPLRADEPVRGWATASTRY